MPRRPPPSKLPRKPLPEEMAKDAIAHEEAVGGDNLPGDPRPSAGRSVGGSSHREEKNIGALVAEILEAAAAKGRA